MKKHMIQNYLPSLEQISLTIQNYSTRLIRITLDNNGNQRMELVGSGTFIKINSTFGILTAQHVLPLLSDHSNMLGLLLIEGQHCFQKPIQYFTLEDIATPIMQDQGPDLGFINIPIEIVREIKPYKSFFDITSDRDELLKNPPLLKAGVWFVNGTPDEYTTRDLTYERPAIILRPYCWLCEANRTYIIDQYDYIEADVFYDQGEQLPLSFGGISGGGLWQVIVEKKGNNELVPIRFFFSGIAFYQSSIDDNRRYIKCHGRTSIYDKLIEHFIL